MSMYTEQKGWRQFLDLCLNADSVEILDKILRLHLTAEEQEDIATRHLIIRELLKGKMTQREMSEALHVSIAKITRGSNSLKIIDKNLKEVLMRSIQHVKQNNA